MTTLLNLLPWLAALASFVAIGAVVGKARTFHKKYLFLVQIDGITYAGFMKCSAAKAKLGVAEHYEGASIVPDNSPGRVKYEPITLERGAAADDDLWKWWRQTCNGAANAGANEPEYRRNVTIVQLARDRVTVLRRWDLPEAFPEEFEAGEWDNDSDDNVIEKMTLRYRYFDRPTTPS